MDVYEGVTPVQTRLDLRAAFPRSKRVILLRSFWFLLVLPLAVVGYWLNLTQRQIPGDSGHIEQGACFLLGSIVELAFVAIVIKLLYEIVYDYIYSYSIELEHLTITKGLLFRSRSSFPLAKINDVSLKRNPLEMFFCVTASRHSDSVARS